MAGHRRERLDLGAGLATKGDDNRGAAAPMAQLVGDGVADAAQPGAVEPGLQRLLQERREDARRDGLVYHAATPGGDGGGAFVAAQRRQQTQRRRELGRLGAQVDDDATGLRAHQTTSKTAPFSRTDGRQRGSNAGGAGGPHGMQPVH